MHRPVLLQKVIESLDIKKDGLYIDATFGEGSHSREIIKKGGRVLGVEWDKQQIFNFQFSIFNKKEKERLILAEGNFADIEKIARENKFYLVDGILFDLGLSMRQLKSGGRGFSFKNLSEPLDMRISNKLKVKASDLVNNLPAEKLYEIFSKYSEEINSLPISQAIVRARSLKKIETVGDLITIINKTIGRKDERVYRRIFQALRIAVNNELENLKKGLIGGLNLLKKDGRMVVITFHSLEDRVVKRFVKENKLKLITKKPIVSQKDLSFERLAKLRVISYQSY